MPLFVVFEAGRQRQTRDLCLRSAVKRRASGGSARRGVGGGSGSGAAAPPRVRRAARGARHPRPRRVWNAPAKVCSMLRSERVACKRMVLSPCSGSSWGCGAARQACRSKMTERERASACASACQAQNAACKQREGGLARTGGPLQGSNGAHNALPHIVSRPD